MKFNKTITLSLTEIEAKRLKAMLLKLDVSSMSINEQERLLWEAEAEKFYYRVEEAMRNN